MKCPKCVAEGKKSFVYPGAGMSTLMYCQPYYDEEGEYHHHDMNSTTYNHRCSEGHVWSETIRPSCPNPKCDWGKDNETSIRFLEDQKPVVEFINLKAGWARSDVGWDGK